MKAKGAGRRNKAVPGADIVAAGRGHAIALDSASAFRYLPALRPIAGLPGRGETKGGRPPPNLSETARSPSGV